MNPSWAPLLMSNLRHCIESCIEFNYKYTLFTQTLKQKNQYNKYNVCRQVQNNVTVLHDK